MKTLHELFGERPQAATSNAPRLRPECMRAAASMFERGMGLDDIARALSVTRAGAAELLRDHYNRERPFR